jgi:Mn2+/Fe2+ NRAMP family transporter
VAECRAVIMPFMLLFQASATAEKLASLEGFERKLALKFMRIETVIGIVITEFLMVMVEMASTGIPDSTNIYSPSDLARVFSSIVGSYSPYFFGLGLLGAGFLALVVISLGSAWGTTEALGIPRNKSYKSYT